jgi:NitT/TauT family transport system substrate-binding protein
VAGGELIIVAGYMNKIASSFFTAKEITRPEQVKGKAVAISGFGTSSHALTEIALKRLGLNPLKDVTIVQVGDQTARFAALQANTIQGTIIAPPLTLLARKNGFNLMLDLPKAGIPWLQQVIISSKAFLLNKPDVTRNFMKGFVEGLALWQTDRDKSTKLLAKFMRIDISKNADILAETYGYMKAVTEKKPYPNGEAIKLQLDMIAETDPKAKKIRPDQVIDLKLLREIDESGFIDRLY